MKSHVLSGFNHSNGSYFSVNPKYPILKVMIVTSLCLTIAEGLREFSLKIVNVDAFITEIQEWIEEKLQVLPSGRTKFHSPFQVDQLRLLDYALVGVSFQQLLRMPLSQSYTSSPGESFCHCNYLRILGLSM